jgi:ribosomal protein S12 methylthiotransferase accessory factor
MIQKPKWKSNFRVERHEPDQVFLFSDTDYYVLNGDIYYHLSPLFNGENTIEDVAKVLAHQFPFYKIHYAVNRLAQKGYLVENIANIYPEIESFCHYFGLDVASSYHKLVNTSLHIITLDNLDKTEFEDALKKMYIPITHSADEADLLVILTPDYLHPEVETIFNNIGNKKPWILIKPNGLIPWFGPLFETINAEKCWKCLSQRLGLYRRLEKTLQYQKQISTTFYPPVMPLPSLTNTIFNMAVMEILKWVLQGENSLLTNHVVTLNSKTLELNKHVFVKRPQCSHCGDPNLIINRTQQPIQLQSRPKMLTTDGSGYRSTTPEAVLEAYQHHISSITGVISYLVKYEGKVSHELINTYAAGVNIQFQATNYNNLRKMLKGGDGGKGTTPAQSKASALGEAIERYSGSFHGNEYFLKASYQELKNKAIHPNEFLNFSEQQYLNGQTFNRSTKSSTYNFVCPRFDETKIINWTPVWSLTNQVHKYVPTDYCYYGASGSNYSATPANSNGCAAGNNLEEAIIQGFMELVERDSVSIWWYNRLQRPLVDLASFNNNYINKLIAFYDTFDRDLWALDITTDLNIPSFVAISRRRSGAREDIIYGFGAHFDPQIALTRALTEVNQVLSSFAMVEGDVPPDFNEESHEWWYTATLNNQPYLAGDPTVPPLTLADYPVVKHTDLKDDVLYCIELARQNDLEVLVLDQTQPDVGLSVARVIVPGLRHFWRRLGPGRLFDVPVKMGWLTKPLTEEELNPYSVFI